MKKLARDFLSLTTLNLYVTAINMVSVFVLARLGDATVLAAVFFAYSTLQLLVNVASFRSESLLARFGFDAAHNPRARVLLTTQALDLVGAVLYGGLALALYGLVQDWFAGKFVVAGDLRWFVLPWLVYILKQTVFGLAVAANRFTSIAVQGGVAATLRPCTLVVLVLLGWEPFTAAAAMYLVSELVSLLLLTWSCRDLVKSARAGPLPRGFWAACGHYYASSTLKLNDNNINESLLPIIAEPKLAACLLLLRKAFALVALLAQPLSTLLLGRLSQLANRRLGEVNTAVIRVNLVMLSLGTAYVVAVSLLQGWLGWLAGFEHWLVSLPMALVFGAGLLLRYLLWWVQPVFTIFSVPLLYLFNALLVAYLAGVYLAGTGGLGIDLYLGLCLAFYLLLNLLFGCLLRRRAAMPAAPVEVREVAL